MGFRQVYYLLNKGPRAVFEISFLDSVLAESWRYSSIVSSL